MIIVTTSKFVSSDSASDYQEAKEVQKKKKNRQPPGVSDETKNIKKPPKTALRK